MLKVQLMDSCTVGFGIGVDVGVGVGVGVGFCLSWNTRPSKRFHACFNPATSNNLSTQCALFLHSIYYCYIFCFQLHPATPLRSRLALYQIACFFVRRFLCFSKLYSSWCLQEFVTGLIASLWNPFLCWLVVVIFHVFIAQCSLCVCVCVWFDIQPHLIWLNSILTVLSTSPCLKACSITKLRLFHFDQCSMSLPHWSLHRNQLDSFEFAQKKRPQNVVSTQARLWAHLMARSRARPTTHLRAQPAIQSRAQPAIQSRAQV